MLEEIATWQARPLEPVYPLVFFDALRVKIRDEGLVRNKAVHIALGVRADGTKEILGLWLEQNEGAKFWLRVMNELRNRGVEDVLLAVVDGLKGFHEAILAVFPEATVQTCIVHLLHHSLDFVSWKDRRAVAAALKDIYRAIDPAAAEAALAAFEAGPWGRKTLPSARAGGAPGRGSAVLRLPGRGPSCPLHDERDRGIECQAAQRRPQPKAPRAYKRRFGICCRSARRRRPSIAERHHLPMARGDHTRSAKTSELVSTSSFSWSWMRQRLRCPHPYLTLAHPSGRNS